MGATGCLRRLRVAPADKPQRRFSGWLQDYRRLEHPRHHHWQQIVSTTWITYTNYNDNKIAPYWFFGAKMRSIPGSDVTGAFYYQSRTILTLLLRRAPRPIPSLSNRTEVFTVTRLNSNKCEGSQDFLSFLIDYRPVKRVDLYAGVMLSNVYGGFANGYQVTRRSTRRPGCASSSEVAGPNSEQAAGAERVRRAVC